MLAGGGTAGHVMPALAVLDALKHRCAQLRPVWVGSERIESSLVPEAGVDFHRIDIRFSYRVPRPGNFGYYRRHILPLLGGKPFRQAQAALSAHRPDVVLATGGYVAAPVVWAALKSQIPVALLEINNPPGLVNWFFADRAWRVYAASEAIAAALSARCAVGKLKVSGCPARCPQRSRARVCRDLDIDPQRRILLAMGGSLGAGAIHRAVRELLFAASRSMDARWHKLAVLNVAGERAALRDGLAGGDNLPAGPVAYYTVDFLDGAMDALAASDFYLGRSGAATVGELLACGLPALLIPDPQHADHQQYGNAELLVQRGQGTLLEQTEVTGEALLSWLGRAWDQPRLSGPQPPAAEVIADDLTSVWETP